MVRIAEDVHRRRDGSEFPVTVTRGTIRDEQGTAVGQVLGVRNLTEERRVTEQLRQHEKLAALGSLVAGVAHELNNPLTGISAFSQLLLEEGLDEEQRESVRLIKREADRAVSVIGDLLLFARKTGAALAEVDVNALLQLAVRLRTYTLRAERITVELDLDPSAPRTVGDEQRLQQVLLNLLVNAEHAMEGAELRRLTLRTRAADVHLLVEVIDTGRGMDAETLDHVFEPFFTTKPAGSGTGLGLSVSYGIVQAHGGAITVESAPGLGTTFRITLPLVVAGEPSEQASQ
jgi:two-component system NtrC family sensor kinase